MSLDAAIISPAVCVPVFSFVWNVHSSIISVAEIITVITVSPDGHHLKIRNHWRTDVLSAQKVNIICVIAEVSLWNAVWLLQSMMIVDWSFYRSCQRRKRDVISSCSVQQPAKREQQLHRHAGRVGTFITSWRRPRRERLISHSISACVSKASVWIQQN